jgi:hypothetical protein
VSASPVHVGEKLPVRSPGCLEFFVSLIDELLEVDELEFELLDALLELADVGGGAEAGPALRPRPRRRSLRCPIVRRR